VWRVLLFFADVDGEFPGRQQHVSEGLVAGQNNISWLLSTATTFSSSRKMPTFPRAARAWSFSQNTFNESHSFNKRVTFIESLFGLSLKVTLSLKVSKFRTIDF
jgi:hypothetical protein